MPRYLAVVIGGVHARRYGFFFVCYLRNKAVVERQEDNNGMV